MEHASEPVKILYIMGAGRSGSTVLNALLGMHPDVEGAGELIHLPQMGWIDNDYCACGERVKTCPFWDSVKKRWNEHAGDVPTAEYLQLRQTLLQQSQRRLRAGFNAIPLSSPAFTRYAELTYALYRSISETSGKSIIVDSSKSPLFGYLLSAVPGLDVRLVHLVRDVRGVTWSYAKALSKDLASGVQKEISPVPAWRTALKWWLVNARAEWVARQRGPGASKRIRYEDILADPDTALAQVGRLVGVDYAQVKPRNMVLNFSHTVAGNRVRTSQGSALRTKDEWTDRLKPGDRRVAETVAIWPMLRYGYVAGQRS